MPEYGMAAYRGTGKAVVEELAGAEADAEVVADAVSDAAVAAVGLILG
jgi:hypothetical protein